MEFAEVITRRESIRKFDGRKPTEAQLAQILEAGRWAPTAFNRQPQRVWILESEEALAKMDQAHPCRYGAKLVLLVCGDATAAAGHGSNSTAATDATIAATQMLLAVKMGMAEPMGEKARITSACRISMWKGRTK